MKTKFNKKGEGALKNPWFYLFAVAAVVLLFFSIRPATTGNVIDSGKSYTVQGENGNVQVSEDDDAVMGDPNAPVTIIEFSDYQCPYCARFENTVFPKIKEEYVDTGKVKVVFRDFPLSFHENAMKAAQASEAARELGGDEAYWKMHELMFSTGIIGVDDLKRYARNIGLDGDAFDKILDSNKYASEVRKDIKDGQVAGVGGTPTFFINGKKLVGAQPFEAFKSVIDGELDG